MPTPDRPPLTRAVVLRGIGFAAAIALGAVAVWLTVTSDSQKSLRIGMLVGLWGLLLGAYSMFGARRGMGVDAEDDPGREIALRERRTVLERSDDADARRDWEARLERLISREISTAVGRETAALRNEIAHLRQELVDKVGGQLRLERIETTRVIGSDLEALQDEVRQLKHASGTQTVRELLVGSDPRLAVRPVVEPARVRPISRPTAAVEADVRPAVRPETPATPAAPPAAPPQRPAQPAAGAPAATADDPAQRAPVSHAAAQAAQARTAGASASQLGGQRRTDTPAVTPAAPLRPAGQPPAADRPNEAERTTPPATPPATASQQPPAAPLQPAGQVRPQRPAAQAPQAARPQQPPAQQPAPQQPPAQQPAPQQPPAQQPAPLQPARPQQPAANRQPAAPPPAPPKPPVDDADPFASLPRLSRFTDFEPDPVDTPSNGGNGHGNGSRHGNGAQQPDVVDAESADAPEPVYTGRRRRAGDDVETDQPSAEHAELAEHAEHADSAAQTRGGRRRRGDDGADGSELLARLLARESAADH